MTTLQDDLTIARNTKLKPVEDIAARLSIPAAALYRFGPFKGKVDLEYLSALPEKKDSTLILVTAISPTPAGEGKTTTTIGLGDAFTRLGYKTAVCLREPSLGPCFGLKGGATGGGHAQVAPMDEINLHFTGDFHAITAAHNLLSAMIDNHIYWGNALKIDPAKITWRRVMDMNDRALRRITVESGKKGTRESGFDITVASEVMAIFCLAKDLKDLEERLGRIVVAETTDGVPVTARDLQAQGAMAVLLADAFRPNLVQTLEGTPAFIHGGPFANIAHGCNSLVATRAALKLADIVVTEAGFGSDLGAEKFFDIKCRQGGLAPRAVVLVATIRALKMHGGVAKADLAAPNTEAVRQGLPNLLRHLRNARTFGLPVVVALNAFTSDTPEEIAVVESACRAEGAPMVLCRHWAEGGRGAEALAQTLLPLIAAPDAFRPLYALDLPLTEKIEKIARDIYGAGSVSYTPAAREKLEELSRKGYDTLPVCMAKTPASFTADPTILGAPTGFDLPIRELRLSAGAGFVVALCGDVMTMPGLPKTPAAHGIHLDADGRIEGLF